MNTSIAGHRDVRNGVIHTGAVALLLGAALTMNTVHAADVDRDDWVAQPAPPAPPASAARPAPAAPPAPARPESATAAKAADERAEVEERLRDAQERMTRAASEVAAIVAERASEAYENFRGPDGRTPRRTIIGVDLDPQSKDGARVLDVSPGGPAEEAGIRAGDVIVMVDGKAVEGDGTPGEASRIVTRSLRGLKADSKVKVRVLRDGKPKDFDVVPRPITNAFAFVPPSIPNIEMPQFNFGPGNRFFGNGDLAGLEVTTLTPQLGRYFGASKGVLVVRAPKSDVYKLQDGDIIVSIDGREPTSGSHITRILSSYQPGEAVTLRVMRDHKSQDIKVTVPERNRQSRLHTTWIGEPM